MKIIAATQKGPGKSENEDRIIIGKSVLASGIFQTEEDIELLAIADGVGGNNAGAVASDFVAHRLTQEKRFSMDAFEKINNDLIALSTGRPEYNNMATTLSGIRFRLNHSDVFSIGNTRVYAVQSGKYLKQITTDDTTLAFLLSTGQISAEDAEAFDRKNEITACFGGGITDLFRIKLNNIGVLSTPVMLTSDGVHDYVSVDQMEDILAEYGVSTEACIQMISAARYNGSKDDTSIILEEM